MSEIIITEQNFEDEVLKSTTPVLLDFWAEWCGPCRMLSPIVEKFSELHNDIKVGTVNVDEEPALAEKFHIVSIPTLVAMENGEIINQSVGYVTIDKIEKLF